MAFDASSDGGRATAGSQTFSQTCTGADLLLVVGVLHGFVEAVSSVTYDSVALSQIGSTMGNHASNYKLSFWRLLGPNTGAHNVVVTMSASSDTMAIAASYTGVSQSGFPDASGSRQPAQAASVTETLTTTVDACWMIWLGLDEFGTGETAGSGTTLRRTSSGYGGLFIADSGGSVGTAGSHSLVMNASNAADWMNDFFISVAPVGAGGGGGDLFAFVGEPQSGSSALL